MHQESPAASQDIYLTFHQMSSRSSPQLSFSGSITIPRIASPVPLCLHKDSLGHRHRPAWCLGLPCCRCPQSGPAGAHGLGVAGTQQLQLALPPFPRAVLAVRSKSKRRRMACSRNSLGTGFPPSRRAVAPDADSKLASAAGWADS